METVTDRVTRYLLARLRRRAVLDLYENAAHVGLLEDYPAHEDEESGTVWTVADNIRLLLTGDQNKDRRLIARRLGTSRTSSTGATLQVFDYEIDQDAELEVRPRTKSRVKHIAASASQNEDQAARPATLIAGQMPMVSTRDVLAMVRQHVPAPNVPQVAVALLVARAVGSSIPDIAAIRRLMSRPDLFVLVKAPVPGFERRFTQLLEDGLLLPYRVKVGDVYHGATLRERHHGEPRTKSRRLVKLLSGDRARHVEHAVLAKHLGDALLDRTSPVIVADETSGAPPPSLAMTADVVFECAGLDHPLLAELLHITLGIAPTLSLKRMQAAAIDLEGLSIDDLTLVIRPSHDLETIVALLPRSATGRETATKMTKARTAMVVMVALAETSSRKAGRLHLASHAKHLRRLIASRSFSRSSRPHNRRALLPRKQHLSKQWSAVTYINFGSKLCPATVRQGNGHSI
jgi:hypothetical protein